MKEVRGKNVIKQQSEKITFNNNALTKEQKVRYKNIINKINEANSINNL